ncbi:MAG TPA: H-NS family nucleoid-associated regulatory protein [Thermoanaerobaculia bacterium]|nr:H-NS family nucleoid-associated regulatory protein [Thermoanaerobaculia bacterium]
MPDTLNLDAIAQLVAAMPAPRENLLGLLFLSTDLDPVGHLAFPKQLHKRPATALLSCAHAVSVRAVAIFERRSEVTLSFEREDLALAQQLLRAGMLLSVPVLDYLLVRSERVVSLAEHLGLASGMTSPEDLLWAVARAASVEIPNARPDAKRTVPAKYRNPENPAEAWTGRGRPPRWLAAKLQAGHSLVEFSIEKIGRHGA